MKQLRSCSAWTREGMTNLTGEAVDVLQSYGTTVAIAINGVNYVYSNYSATTSQHLAKFESDFGLRRQWVSAYQFRLLMNSVTCSTPEGYFGYASRNTPKYASLGRAILEKKLGIYNASL